MSQSDEIPGDADTLLCSLALAQQLQAEEDGIAQREYDRRQQEQERKRQLQIEKEMSRKDKSRKAKKDCIIM